MMTSSPDYKSCAEILSAHDDFIILTHKNPDGDTVGSAGALCLALRRIGKHAFLYNNEQFTDKLRSYVGELTAGDEFIPAYKVAVDVASETQFPIGFAEKVDLCIDHHPSNTHYAGQLFLDPDRASCAELIYRVLQNLPGAVTAEEATLLYLGLSTDTGCFQYGNTDQAAFAAAAELMACGADNQRVNIDYFRKLSRARIRLEGLIYAGLEYYHNGDIVVASVTLDMLQKAQATKDDCDDLAALAARVDGSKLSMTIKEQEDGTCRVSMRSMPGVNCSEICAVYGGGGHAAASGCSVKAGVEEAKRRLIETAERFIK